MVNDAHRLATTRCDGSGFFRNCSGDCGSHDPVIDAQKKLVEWVNLLFFSLLYSVPSFAFFALLLPISGLGMRTAIIVLTIYCEYVLLRTFITGIQEIDPALIEVAKGMGMTRKQVFFKVQLPLATPAIFSGLQVALASTMGIATIAATINAGGLDSYYLKVSSHSRLCLFYGEHC